MARQAGGYWLVGTIDELTYYQMDGLFYARKKSSLTARKFWKHKSFERSRESCKRFGEGNALASLVYRMVDKDKKGYKLFCYLKRRAILFLKEGKDVGLVKTLLMEELRDFGLWKEEKKAGERRQEKGDKRPKEKREEKRMEHEEMVGGEVADCYRRENVLLFSG